jgi:hypothetical protein
MKICTKCGATYPSEMQFCTVEEMILIEIEISPVMTDEFLEKSFNNELSNAPTPIQTAQVQNSPVVKFKTESKWILALKLWGVFAVLLIGSIFLVLIGLKNFNKTNDFPETNINNSGTAKSNQNKNSNENIELKSNETQKTYQIKKTLPKEKSGYNANATANTKR